MSARNRPLTSLDPTRSRRPPRTLGAAGLAFWQRVQAEAEDFAMAEINKLSVGRALDKLRRPDVQSKQTRLHEKMDALDEDIQRMRATRRRLERDQRAAETTASDAQGMTQGPTTKKGRSQYWASSLLLAWSF